MTRNGPLPSRHLFRVSRHAGVWRLIHNGVFYRDYISEAVKGQHLPARALDIREEPVEGDEGSEGGKNSATRQ